MNMQMKQSPPLSFLRLLLALGLQFLLMFVWSFALGLGLWTVSESLSWLREKWGAFLVLWSGAFNFVVVWASVTPVVRWVVRRPWAWLGWRGFLLREMLYGLLDAGWAWVAIAGMLTLTGSIAWQRASVPWASWFALWVVLFLGAAAEEWLARGFWFSLLKERLGPYWAMFLSSLVFALLHMANPAWSWRAAVGIFLAGMVLAWARHQSDSLAWPIAFHWGWNAFQGLVFGFPVSGLVVTGLLIPRVTGPDWWTGGPFGPEAGLASWLILLAVAFWRFPPVRQGANATEPLEHTSKYDKEF